MGDGTGFAVGVGAAQALASMDSTTSTVIRNHTLRILRSSSLSWVSFSIQDQPHHTVLHR
jgi:hypothetical protein